MHQINRHLLFIWNFFNPLYFPRLFLCIHDIFDSCLFDVYVMSSFLYLYSNIWAKSFSFIERLFNDWIEKNKQQQNLINLSTNVASIYLVKYLFHIFLSIELRLFFVFFANGDDCMWMVFFGLNSFDWYDIHFEIGLSPVNFGFGIYSFAVFFACASRCLLRW